MSLYRRGKIWWIDFVAPDGTRVQESTRTSDKIAAQEYHDKRKAESWRIVQLKERPKYTWEQAVVRWLRERAHKKSLQDDKHHLKRLDQHLSGVQLHTVDRTLIDSVTASRLSDGVSNATVNRMLEVLRAILRAAEREWDWIERAPHVRMLQEPKRRIRWLTRIEADRLMSELPAHLRDLVAFSLATGLRESNVVGLRWNQLDLERKVAWIHLDEAKGKKAIPVPLNEDAVEAIERQKDKHKEFVFTYGGEPVTRANNHAWRKALKRAGIEKFRWHDLRHTWASWHIQNGTPLHILQELGSWESSEMVRRYAHLAADHLAPYAGNVQRKTGIKTEAEETGEKEALET